MTSQKGSTVVSWLLVGQPGHHPCVQDWFLVGLPEIGKGLLADGLLAPEVPSGAEQGFLVTVIQ